MNLSIFARSCEASSVWALRVIGFERSRLNIPMIDLASTAYLPETRSMSKSKLITMFTNSLTSLIAWREILNVVMINYLLKLQFMYCHFLLFIAVLSDCKYIISSFSGFVKTISENSLNKYNHRRKQTEILCTKANCYNCIKIL